MKKIINTRNLVLLFLLLFFTTNAIAQPFYLNYQVTVYNPDGSLFTNGTLDMMFEFREGASDGAVIYSESYVYLSTDQFGRVNLELGYGSPISGDFSAIDWSSEFYLAEFVDLSGSQSYTEMGVTQLISVPYAFHAENANVVTYDANGAIPMEEPTVCNAENEGTLKYDFTNQKMMYCDGTDWRNFYQELTLVPEIYHVNVTGANDAAVYLYPVGGKSPYTINWVGGGTTQDSLNISAGNYTVNVSDYHGNTITVNFTVTEPPSVTDKDGNTYSSVKIGEQIWMAENLRVTNTPAGESLVDGTGVGDITSDYSTKYYFAYNDNLDYVANYGYLYTRAAALNGGLPSDANPSGAQGICPDGWHLPSESEWQELSDYLGGDADAASVMYQEYSTDWSCAPELPWNSFFNAKPAGYRSSDGVDNISIQGSAYWWTSSGFIAGKGNVRTISYCGSYELSGTELSSDQAFSIRCVKDK